MAVLLLSAFSLIRFATCFPLYILETLLSIFPVVPDKIATVPPGAAVAIAVVGFSTVNGIISFVSVSPRVHNL